MCANKKIETFFLKCPLGFLQVQGDERGIRLIQFSDVEEGIPIAKSDECKEAGRQLEEYFSGCREGFTLNLALDGTLFQSLVWKELQTIPFGTTLTYGEIARCIGHPGAARAVGLANHKNPLAIVVPCHRVVGSGGKLVGYGGGLWRKSWLLEHEKKVSESRRK